MVQLLEVSRPKSNGEKLVKYANDATTQFVDVLKSRRDERQENEAVKRLTGEDISGFHPERRKDVINALLKQKGEQKEALYKQQAEQYEKQQEKNKYIGLLKDLKALKPYTGFNWKGSADRNVVQKKSSIKAAGAALADYTYTTLLNNKGALSEAKIAELMKPYLITPDDSERTYQGKLDILERLYDIAQTRPIEEEDFENFKKPEYWGNEGAENISEKLGTGFEGSLFSKKQTDKKEKKPLTDFFR